MMEPWEVSPPQTIEDAVKLAKTLRCVADDAELQFMRYLRWLEDREDLWRASQEVSFDSFLEKVIGIKPSRYSDAREALVAFGPKLVEDMGLHGAIVATRVPEEKREEAISKVRAIREANGVPASRQNARQVLASAHLLPPVEKSKAQTKLSRVAELEKACAELRSKLAAAERRAAEAEARAERYVEQLRAAGIKPKDAPKRKRAA